MAIAEHSCRISYRYRPSGEHRLRCVPLRPIRKYADGPFINSSEVQGTKRKTDKNGLRSGFGKLPRKTVFGKRSKERVRDACAILDQTYGKRCLFATGTLPGSTDAAFQTLAKYSAYLIQRIKQWLRDNFPGIRTVWVWELQKRGALHLHCVFGHADWAVLEKLAGLWHEQWCLYLQQISEMSGIDLFEDAHGYSYQNNLSAVRTDIQFVEKSVGRYLSKYVSKGAGEGYPDNTYCPSRWWGIDAWLKVQVVLNTVTKVFKVGCYADVITFFDRLCEGFREEAVEFYRWKNPYDPFAHTAVCWLNADLGT